MNVPERHRKLAHAWVDGAEVEYLSSIGGWAPVFNPTWDEGSEYRIKPKVVKKWQWLIRSFDRKHCYVGADFFTSKEEIVKRTNIPIEDILKPIPETLITAEVES